MLVVWGAALLSCASQADTNWTRQDVAARGDYLPCAARVEKKAHKSIAKCHARLYRSAPKRAAAADGRSSSDEVAAET